MTLIMAHLFNDKKERNPYSGITLFLYYIEINYGLEELTYYIEVEIIN